MSIKNIVTKGNLGTGFSFDEQGKKINVDFPPAPDNTVSVINNVEVRREIPDHEGETFSHAFRTLTSFDTYLQKHADGTLSADSTYNFFVLYVDSQNGDDDAIGSITKPLRTLNEALKRRRPVRNLVIRLKAGGTYTIGNGIGRRVTRGSSLIITSYGDSYLDSQYAKNNNVAYTELSYLAKPSTAKPVINIQDSVNGVFNSFFVNEGGNLIFSSVTISLNTAKNSEYYSNVVEVADGTVHFAGCEFTRSARGNNKVCLVAKAPTLWNNARILFSQSRITHGTSADNYMFLRLEEEDAVIVKDDMTGVPAHKGALADSETIAMGNIGDFLSNHVFIYGFPHRTFPSGYLNWRINGAKPSITALNFR